ncbi:MAG: hypothetical protein AAGA45_01345 [Verrucomicrobiota bacterium]
MKLPLFLLLATGLFADSCQQESQQDVDEPRQIWLYIQFNVPEDDIVDSQWLYGLVENSVYQDLQDGDEHGYITLRKVRYYDADADQILEYEDGLDKGIISFRRKYVAIMYEIKDDPLEVEPELESVSDNQALPLTEETSDEDQT